MWLKANPNLDVSLIRETLASKVTQAQASRHMVPGIRLKHFNEWGENTDSWIDRESWTRCASKNVDDFEGQGRLYVGVDLASTADLCAVGSVIPAQSAATRSLT